MAFEKIKEALQLSKIKKIHSDIMSYNPKTEESRLHSNVVSQVQGKISLMGEAVSKSRSLRVWNQGMNNFEMIKKDFNNPDIRRYAAEYMPAIESRYKDMFKKTESFKGSFQKRK